MIKIIAAVTSDMALGKKGDLLYHISDDLKRFKSLTMGSAIVMGRKTFESFPKGALPGRRNMVITRDPNYSAPGIETFHTVDDAIKAANGDCFVIGGGNIYEQFMNVAHELLLTEIDATCQEADTFFPSIDYDKWQLIEKSDTYTDQRSGVSYCFTRYVRNNS